MPSTSKFNDRHCDGCCNVPSNLHANLYYQEQDVGESRRIAVNRTRCPRPPGRPRARAAIGRGRLDRRYENSYRRRQPRPAYEISRRTILDVHKPMTIRYNQRYNPTPRESCDVCSSSPHSRNHASSALSAHIAPLAALSSALFFLSVSLSHAPCAHARATAIAPPPLPLLAHEHQSSSVISSHRAARC